MFSKRKLLSDIDNHFKSLKLCQSKVGTPTKITINGQQIRLSNGKSLWKRVGDAKCALRNELDKVWQELIFDHTKTRFGYFTGDYYSDKKLKEEIYQYVLANIIRFESAIKENEQ